MLIAFTFGVAALLDPADAIDEQMPGGPPVIEERLAPGSIDALMRKAGCVVVGVNAHPDASKKRALFVRVCPSGDASVVEERGVVDGRRGVVRFRRMIVD